MTPGEQARELPANILKAIRVIAKRLQAAEYAHPKVAHLDCDTCNALATLRDAGLIE